MSGVNDAAVFDRLLLEYGRKCMWFGYRGPDEYPGAEVDEAREAVRAYVAALSGAAKAVDPAWEEIMQPTRGLFPPAMDTVCTAVYRAPFADRSQDVRCERDAGHDGMHEGTRDAVIGWWRS